LDREFNSMWTRTFVVFVFANALLVGVEFVNLLQSSWLGSVLGTVTIGVNYPGFFTGLFVMGDEWDERFGTQWAAILMWIFSLPWLALGAAVVSELRANESSILGWAAELPDGADVALFGIGSADMMSPVFGEFNDSLKVGHAAHPACLAGMVLIPGSVLRV
jgi:hypothetical protein